MNMEYDSESSCEDRLRDLEACENLSAQRTNLISRTPHSIPWHSVEVVPTQSKVALNIANKTLSKQVMEYYQKYSQNSNLDQYFSLPASSGSSDGVKYYYSIYELNPKLDEGRENCVGQDYNLRSYVPKERRRWARPPLIGQSSTAETPSIYMQPLTDPRSPSPEQKRAAPETIIEEKNESRETIPEAAERKAISPTSSVASHKPLEWDSGADVGYFNTLPQNRENGKELSTIERMALARGCSAALRQDPEGTTESGSSVVQPSTKSMKKPGANSTPKLGMASASESEVEITPIVKNHLPGIITGDDIKSQERKNSKEDKPNRIMMQTWESNVHIMTETPKSASVFKVPPVKYATVGKKTRSTRNIANENVDEVISSLKKSSSMNVLAPVASKLTLKRSQSEFYLHVKDKCKVLLPLIFDSTSSLATIVNKPTTCDKLIQTTINEHNHESVGVQVSVLEDDRPPLPKRGTSLNQKSIHSILKNPMSTYRLQNAACNNSNSAGARRRSTSSGDRSEDNEFHPSSSETSRNDSQPLSPHLHDTENVTGRANSFEYFPRHVYENVPNGSAASHISSIDTGRSNSTMPNTSSSIDEKLWGDSDSLVKDLERSVNILKSLVDANKCDKQVKKRLIHHVVKRLVTAKYTDDRIEHNLEETVPWNPDDARKKVYRAEIIQALTNKQNTTDSSEEWRPQKKSASSRKATNDDVRIAKEIINLESSNSDKFDGHTDRTEMDGRKARMGLRTDDCQHSSNTVTDANKSESSECFLPQRGDKLKKLNNVFCLKKKNDLLHEETSTSNTPSDQNRLLLEAVVNNRQSPIQSSNDTRNSIDWRLPTTLSERQFDLRRCKNSNSGDSKLVSYAEMEKKNQLIWITNEISHLSNLKKLLEQPKKLERMRASPKKTKHAISMQKPLTVLTCVCGQNNSRDGIQRKTPDACGSSVNEQWSSHCNLANCQPAASTSNKITKYLRHRNSCTQTSTDIVSAHSRTGGEIISPSIHRNATTKLSSAYSQTLSSSQSRSSPASKQLQSAQPVVCPVHQPHAYVQQCQCTGLVCNCGRQFSIQARQNAQKSICLCHAHDKKNYAHSFSSICQCAVPASHSKEERSFISQTVVPNTTNRACVDYSKSTAQRDDKESGNSQQKEAKNKLNATKSKFEAGELCHCIEKCNCENARARGEAAKCKKLLDKVCKLCCKSIAQSDAKSIACECDQCNSGKICVCSNYCVCENREVNDVRPCDCPNVCNCKSKESNQARTSNAPCNNCADCNCDKNGEVCNCDGKKQDDKLYKQEEVQNEKKVFEQQEKTKQYDCSCHSKPELRKGQMKPHTSLNSLDNQMPQSSKVQNLQSCGCGKDCSCANKINDIERRLYSPKHSARANCQCETKSNDSDRNSKYCRSCGSTYQNGRECGCQMNYPKSVAYELSFVEKDEKRNADVFFSKQNNVEIKALPKLSQNSSPSNTPKTGSCFCEDAKAYRPSKNGNQKKTLQDYLATNKPSFVDDAETRRQCLSEISHLRELRKEKRVQLLALATGSNVRTPRSPKPTVCSQRKISDEEMRGRLHKRYLRLNEVHNKRRQQEKQEEARRNNLMASIFSKKLQQKVLKGQVDLSNSVSVISSLSY